MNRAMPLVALIAIGCSGSPPAEPVSTAPTPPTARSDAAPKPKVIDKDAAERERQDQLIREYQLKREREMHGDTPEYFEEKIRPFLAMLGKVKTEIVYEGLPHQYFEEELLKKELKDKKTIELRGWPFYDPGVATSEADGKKLLALFADPKTLSRWSGEKFCGAFHPDWCIELRGDEGTCRLLVCFGCMEVTISSPKDGFQTDLNTDAGKQLYAILKQFEKNRPKRGPKG